MEWSHAAARATLAIVAWTGTLASQTIPPKLTLETAVELALAQRQSSPPPMHPCAYARARKCRQR